MTRAEGEFDTRLKVLASGVVLAQGLSQQARGRGTTVTVRDFLHCVPVRRRLLLADAAGEVERCRGRLLALALARPDVALSLHEAAVAGRAAAPPPRSVLACAASRTVPATFAAAYGAELAARLVPLRAGEPWLSGWVAMPGPGSHGAPSPEAGHLFVNGRPVRRCALHRALDGAFEAAGRAQERPGGGSAVRRRPNTAHAACVLLLRLPPAHADLLFEPDKTVVAFRDEPALLRRFARALLDAWRIAGCPQHALDAAAAALAGEEGAAVPPAPPEPTRATPAKRAAPQAAHLGNAMGNACAPGCGCARAPFKLGSWPKRRAGSGVMPRMDISDAASLGLAPRTLLAATLASPRTRLLAALPGTFLLALGADGALLAVDQHAADERVLLERLSSEPRAAAAASEALALSPMQAAALRAHAKAVAAFGWATQAGPPVMGGAMQLLITQAPTVAGVQLSAADLSEWLHALAQGAAAREGPLAARRTLASRACRGAIMFGDELRTWEGRALLAALGATRQPLACAHGRPTAAPLVNLDALTARLEAGDRGWRCGRGSNLDAANCRQSS